MLNYMDAFNGCVHGTSWSYYGMIQGYLVRVELVLIVLLILVLSLSYALIALHMVFRHLHAWIGTIRRKWKHLRSRNCREKNHPVIVYREDPEFEELWEKYVESKEGQL